MKNYLFLLLLAVATPGLGQTADTHDAFNRQKQSVVLRTGITMKYIDAGNPKGTPVILLHGATDTGRSFGPTLDTLARRNGTLRILVPDLRGHGETAPPDAAPCAGAPETCFTPALFAADILALLDAKNIAKVHVVGHSMGSVIGQELALRHPDRVSSLVLIGTFVNGKAARAIHDFILPTMVEGQLKAAWQQREKGPWPQAAYAVTPEVLGDSVTAFLRANWVAELGTDPAYLDAIHRETVRVPVGTWVGIFMALGAMDNREAMAGLKVPTLVLNASQDMICPEPDQQQVKAALQRAASRHGTRIFYKTYGKIPLPASGQQVNDLGHNLQWAAPGPVAADIAAFILHGAPTATVSYLDPQHPNQVRTEESVQYIQHYGRPGSPD